jgi:hypothetical protein
MRKSFAHLKEAGTSAGDPAAQYDDIHGLMGFAEVWDFEKRWAT